MKKLHLFTIAVLLLLCSCGGSSSPEGSSSNAKAPAASGEDIYKRTCIACHLPTGEGVAGTFPPLAKSDYLANKEAAIKQVIKGSSGDIVVNGKTFNNVMPPQPLSDAEVAAVLTYVYSSFGNNACTITPDEIKQVRAKL